MVSRLRKEGDRVDDKMNVLGMFPLTPLMMLATWHRTDAVRALLDAGARVDEPGRSRAPRDPRGADVNHVDKKGMKPLLYAASIDFGDSAMVELLAQVGRPDGCAYKRGLDRSRFGA